MAKAIKLLDKNYLVKDALLYKCRGSSITGYAADVLPLHEELFKIYFWPISNRHLNFLDGRVRRAGENEADWKLYKDDLAKNRAGTVHELISKLTSMPHNLEKVKGLNKLCSFLKWVVDAIVEYMQRPVSDQ